MSQYLDSFKQFMKKREDAAREYVCGDPTAVDSISTRVSPATFFGPGGNVSQSAGEVLQEYNQGNAMFRAGGGSHFEILNMGSGEGLAYWTGFQHATVLMKEKEEAIPMKLRVTEIFRLEDNQWKMIHRHADFAK